MKRYWLSIPKYPTDSYHCLHAWNGQSMMDIVFDENECRTKAEMVAYASASAWRRRMSNEHFWVKNISKKTYEEFAKAPYDTLKKHFPEYCI